MARRKTHEEFVAEVKALVGDEYTVVGTYVNTRTKINMFHNICGETYPVRPKEFLIGQRCPKCMSIKKTTDQFKQEIYDIVGDEYNILGEYVTTHTKINMFHNICGETYPVRPSDFLKGKRCPKCMSTKKTTGQFKQEIYDLVGDEYNILGEYVNARTKINMFHNICGETYPVRPSNFLKGQRCPKCRESKGERKINDWLLLHRIPNIPQLPIKYFSRKKPLKLDFYVQGVAVEFDGEYHYKSMPHAGGEKGLRAQQRRDRIKDKYCADNGIPLIRIPYWDFDNIDAILTEKLLPLLEEKAA